MTEQQLEKYIDVVDFSKVPSHLTISKTALSFSKYFKSLRMAIIHNAAKHGQQEILNLPIYNNLSEIEKFNFFILCASFNQIKIIKLLLKKTTLEQTTKVNLLTKNMALSPASSNGHLETVDILLKSGAMARYNNDEALRYASFNGHSKVVSLLIKYGAKIDSKNDESLRFSIKNNHTETVSVLLKNGASVRRHKEELISYALENHNTEILDMISRYA